MEEYRVLSVLPLGKKKYKIALEGTVTIELSLYPSEVRKYSLQEGNTLSCIDFEEIRDVLYKRGKERALYYLKSSDKTVSQMRTKLKEGYYPEDIIEKVIEFLERYGYLDDYRFAQNFVSYNKHRKSIQRMKSDLCLKGIEKSIIEDVLMDSLQDGDTEEYLIEAYCKKKVKNNMDEKECNKILMSLMRKGFKYENAKSVLRRVVEESTT